MCGRRFLGACAAAESHAGGTRTADAILDQVERDLVANNQLVERAGRRVAPMKEHFAPVGISNEAVALS